MKDPTAESTTAQPKIYANWHPAFKEIQMEKMQQFHLLSKLISMPKDGQEKFINAINELYNTALALLQDCSKFTDEEVDQALILILNTLNAYHSMAFGYILKPNGLVDQDKLMIEVKADKISFLAGTFINTIDTFILYAGDICIEQVASVESKRLLLNHAIGLLFTVYGWMSQEIGVIPDAAAHVAGTATLLAESAAELSRMEIIAKSNATKDERNQPIYERIAREYHALMAKQPELTKVKASEIISAMTGIPWSPRVVAKYFPKG